MENTPKNIFEQVMYALKAVNDNIYTLSENLSVVNEKLDALDAKVDMFNFSPIDFEEPTVSGSEEETATECGDGSSE